MASVTEEWDVLSCHWVSLCLFQQLLCSCSTDKVVSSGLCCGWDFLVCYSHSAENYQPFIYLCHARVMLVIFVVYVLLLMVSCKCWVWFVFKIIGVKGRSFFSGLRIESSGIICLISYQNNLPSPLSLQRIMFSLLVPITIIINHVIDSCMPSRYFFQRKYAFYMSFQTSYVNRVLMRGAVTCSLNASLSNFCPLHFPLVYLHSFLVL